MKQYHNLMLRLCPNPRKETGEMSGPDADAHLGKYAAEGWAVKFAHTVSTDQTAFNVYLLLERDAASPAGEVAKAVKA